MVTTNICTSHHLDILHSHTGIPSYHKIINDALQISTWTDPCKLMYILMLLLQQTEMFEQHKGVQYCKLADIDMQV